ncbi:uncharacterized protein LOC143188955 [Calliopsis andreniformis]|uniref:uncharacterized protein LOC143188955 n=1 Tax=Calliopsis andreniformis TaxID=337506 RepID=UPI003FCDFD1D
MNGSDKELKEVVLRDLEPVLQQKLGDQVIVENFTTKSLLPPGENFGSTILSVNVDYKNGHEGQKKELHLIAKMLPPTEFQRRIFNSERTFTKEIFMYETIIPAYNKLETECGLRQTELFDILPKFYGSRLSMQPDQDFDDNAVFLMENLKTNGYYTGNRSIGYDIEHSEMAVKTLARFHALGIALKQKKPGIFEMFKMHARYLKIEGNPDAMFTSILEKIKEDPEMSLYYDKCQKVLTGLEMDDLWADVPREPWMTIIHSDFWVNNILFHRNAKNQLDDIKFVDFQMYLYSSCIRDLIFYLFSSVVVETSDSQLEELMDLYYETLINTLTTMKCDTSVFSKEAFREKMAEDAQKEFIHLCFLTKIITIDVQETNFNYDKMQNVVVDYGGSQRFIERLRRIVLYFGKHDWV